MKKDLEKLAEAPDSELFKELGISADEAKTFERGARHLFGDKADKGESPIKPLDIRAHAAKRVEDGDIRKRESS